VIERTNRVSYSKALIVDDELNDATAWGRASRALVAELEANQVEMVQAISPEDGGAVVVSDAGLRAVLIDWSFSGDDPHTHARARGLIETVRARNRNIPIFLMAERDEAGSIPLDILQLANEFVWTLEDTAPFIAGRVLASMERYRGQLLGPMTAALLRYARVSEYSWHTPGHTGGTAFLKSPSGRAFYDYFGENLFRSDLSISVPELGSLLDHTGPIGEGERYAARVFGAHRSYCVTNGTSTANRIILTASVARGRIVLCDRNCHKSIEHALTMTGGIPVYLRPSRNRYGLIGPIYTEHLRLEAISEAIAANPLTAGTFTPRAVHCIITNSTYDGLCTKTTRQIELLDPSVDRIHFDEAWYAYARFHPLYVNRFGMNGEAADHRGPTVFATHSTHKVLAALSQASFIHVRDGRSAIPQGRLNEAFMMHSSTSPFYPIIASNDVATSMMDGPGGRALTSESIQEAVGFRQMIGRIRKQFEGRGQWFFETWNAQTVTNPDTFETYPFEEAPEDLLVNQPACWVLRPGDAWHGFEGIEDDYAMLDPVKVSVVTPGIDEQGELMATGIPAELVAAYLDTEGIQVEKTTDFTILFLFTLGITKGKWGTLVNGLLEFKRLYDANAPLEHVLPAFVVSSPKHYRRLGLKDLANEMFDHLKTSQQVQWQAKAFGELPQVVMSPADAYQRLLHNEADLLTLDEMPGRIVATGIVPYPPGIPLLMPGERARRNDGPFLSYLRALEAWDARFPGFAHETHGVDRGEDRKYRISCLRE
jgi:arginine decarboxylase